MNPVKTAKANLLRKGRTLRNIVEMSEAGRVTRAANVTFAYAVMRRNHILGGAISSRGDDGYEVSIDIDRRTFRCSCDDHGRSGGACKHVVALANRWLANVGRPEWDRLTALEAPTPASPTPASPTPSRRKRSPKAPEGVGASI